MNETIKSRAIYFSLYLIFGLIMKSTNCNAFDSEYVHMADEAFEKPLPINTGSRVLAIGNGFSVGIKKDGTVWTWGKSRGGILARKTSSSIDGYEPGQVIGLKDAVSVSASESVYILNGDGEIWGWGKNNYSQLGVDNNSPGYVGAGDVMTPKKVSGVPAAVSVMAAGSMGVALSKDGHVWVWGASHDALAGAFDDKKVGLYSPRPIKGLSSIKRISATETVIAAIDENGSLWTVGSHIATGRMLSESTPPKELVGRVDLPGKVVDVDLGRGVAGVALLDNGQVWTWGRNDNGQLGLGHRRPAYVPQRVDSLSRIKLIGAGFSYMTAVSESGDVIYWGDIFYAKPPLYVEPVLMQISSPIRLKEHVSVVGFSEQNSSASAYLSEDGTAWFFGWNRRGERGVGTAKQELPLEYILTPQKSHWHR